MSVNATAINRRQQQLVGRSDIWLFGYGSLIYKAGFPYLERRPATIDGWARRFWQGSHDHRGTPQAPGRVLTLIAQQDAACGGMAYRVTPAEFGHLDHREKNGYLRTTTAMTFADGSHTKGLVYIAGPDNPAYLGPATVTAIAEQIARSRGPSGHNREYLLDLATALRELGYDDPHVFEIEHALLAATAE